MNLGIKRVSLSAVYMSGLALVVLLFFNRMLSCHDVFIERDLSAFFIPPKLLWVRLMRSGIFPWWNPNQYSGIPLLAALQPGVLYPPHLLYLFLPFPVVWNWLIILHFLLAGISVFLLLRYLKSSETGAFVGAVIFMLSGYLISVHNLLPHLFAVAWFPLILLYFLKHFETGQMRYAVLSALFLLMQFLSGAPEILMLTLLALFIMLLFLPAFIESRVGLLGRLRSFGVIAFLLLLLSGVQLLPFYELKAQSIRQHGLTYQEASVWSMAWRDFIQFFIPDLFGNLQNDQKYWHNQSWLKTIYLGIVPFFLSAFFFVTRDRRRWPLALLLAISLLFALGGNTPLYTLICKIPPFNSVRYPVKFLFLFFFVISVTSGLGIDRLRSGVENKDRRTEIVILVAFYTGFFFVLIWSYLTLLRGHAEMTFDRLGLKPDLYNVIDINIHDIRRFCFFSFVFCVLLLVYLRVARRKLLMHSIVLLLTLDLFLANYGFYTHVSWREYTEGHPFAQAIEERGALDRYFITPKTHKALDRFPWDRMILAPAYAPVLGLYAFEGAEVLRLTHYDMFMYMVKSGASLEEARRLIDVAGIRYIITTAELEQREFTRLAETRVRDQTVYLYEYNLYPGRFRFFARVHAVPDEASMVAKMIDRTVDLRSELILLSKSPVSTQPGSEGNVRLVSYTPNRVVLESEASGDGLVYVSDAYYPGWKAYVDGEKTDILRANLAFRAIRVPSGRHTVSLVYVPFSFYLGLGLTGIGLALSLVLARKRQ
jgi:hypothetical protein